MPPAALLVALVGTLGLDPRGVDPAALKLPLLTGGVGALLLMSAVRRRAAPGAPLDWLVAAGLALSLVAAGRAPFPARGVHGPALSLLGAGAYFLCRRECTASQLARGLGLVSLAVAASQAAELVLPVPWSYLRLGGSAPETLVGALANPNLSASALLLGAPAALAWGGPPAALLLGAALLGSFCRGAWLAAGLTYLAARATAPTPSAASAPAAGDPGARPAPGPARDPARPRRGPGGRWKASLAAAAALALAALALGPNRLRPTQVFGLASLGARAELAATFYRGVRRGPWLGWGPHGGAVAYAVGRDASPDPGALSDHEDFAHNPLLQRAVAAGLPGAAFGLVFMIVAAGRVRAGLREAAPSPRRQLALGLFAFTVAEAVSVGFERAALRALAAAALAGLAVPAAPGAPGAAPSPGPRGPPARGPLAAVLGLALLALTPTCARLAYAQVLRRDARGGGPGRVARSLALDAPHRYPALELRYDAAVQLAMERKFAGARARLLVLEALAPGYGSSAGTRRTLREAGGAATRPEKKPRPAADFSTR